MKNLHKDDVELFLFMKKQALHYARMYGLPTPKSIKPLPKKHCWFSGFCYDDRRIRLRVRETVNGKWAKQPDKAYFLVDTIAHELAHLRHQNHGNHWFSLHASILSSMAEGGVYLKIRELVKSK